MIYPACSIRLLWLGRDIATCKLHSGKGVERWERHASGVRNGVGPSRPGIFRCEPEPVKGQAFDGVLHIPLELCQDQEVTQKREAAGPTEDRCGPRHRNSGSADSGTLSGWSRHRSMGRQVASSDGEVPV